MHIDINMRNAQVSLDYLTPHPANILATEADPEKSSHLISLAILSSVMKNPNFARYVTLVLKPIKHIEFSSSSVTSEHNDARMQRRPHMVRRRTLLVTAPTADEPALKRKTIPRDGEVRHVTADCPGAGQRPHSQTICAIMMISSARVTVQWM